LVVNAISESIRLDAAKLEQAFIMLAERHVKGELAGAPVEKKEDRITGERLEEEAEESDGEVVKSDKEQIAINTARRKGKLTKPRTNKKKIPETLQKGNKQKEAQTTLDKVVVDDAKPKRRKSK
jgi:hypothetical protein